MDNNKVHDRVEWLYLEAIMRKLGFNEKWINLIMHCAKTVKFSVLINKQGDLCHKRN